MLSENGVRGRNWNIKTEEVTGACRKLRSENLHDAHFSPDIIMMIISRSMRWTGM
jgi:hypothetical protein